MKIEIWNGHEIRFVWHGDEWWAIAVDITKALNLDNTTRAIARLDPENVVKYTLSTGKGIAERLNPEVNIVSEFGIYDLIFSSKRPEAKEFKKWIFETIKTLRQSSGLEGFQIFKMLDREHQKKAMEQLHSGLSEPQKVSYIKANQVTNRAVSTKYGFAGLVKKEDMTPEMLIDRQKILDDTTELMVANKKFGLGLSISKTIYGIYCPTG